VYTTINPSSQSWKQQNTIDRKARFTKSTTQSWNKHSKCMREKNSIYDTQSLRGEISSAKITWTKVTFLRLVLSKINLA